MSAYEEASVVLGALAAALAVGNLLILGLTLYWVGRYTRAAQDQVAAALDQVRVSQEQVRASRETTLVAVEQMEAAAKPCVIPMRRDSDGNIGVVNIGEGPALNLSYSFIAADENLIVNRPRVALAAAGPLAENWYGVIADRLMPIPGTPKRYAVFEASYQSMSGTWYRTRVPIQHPIGWQLGPLTFQRVEETVELSGVRA